MPLWARWVRQRRRTWSALVQSRCNGLHTLVVESGIVEYTLTAWLENTTPLTVEEHLDIPPDFVPYNHTYPLRTEAAWMVACIARNRESCPMLHSEVVRVVKRYALIELERKRAWAFKEWKLQRTACDTMQSIALLGSGQLADGLKRARVDSKLQASASNKLLWEDWIRRVSQNRPLADVEMSETMGSRLGAEKTQKDKSQSPNRKSPDDPRPHREQMRIHIEFVIHRNASLSLFDSRKSALNTFLAAFDRLLQLIHRRDYRHVHTTYDSTDSDAVEIALAAIETSQQVGEKIFNAFGNGGLAALGDLLSIEVAREVRKVTSHAPKTNSHALIQEAIDKLGDSILRVHRAFEMFAVNDGKNDSYMPRENIGRILLQLGRPDLKVQAELHFSRSTVLFEDFVVFLACHNFQGEGAVDTKKRKIKNATDSGSLPALFKDVCKEFRIDVDVAACAIQSSFQEVARGRNALVGISELRDAIRRACANLGGDNKLNVPSAASFSKWATNVHHGWPNVQEMQFKISDCYLALCHVFSDEHGKEEENMNASKYDAIEAHVMRAFRKYDVDDDGKITFSDLRRAFDALGRKHVPDEKLRSWIEKRDTDGDGTVTLRDFVDAYVSNGTSKNMHGKYAVEERLKVALGAPRIEALKRAFEKYDINRDGKIDFGDMRIAFDRRGRGDVSDTRLAEWIFERDSTGNGHVTFQDFVETYRRDKSQTRASLADDNQIAVRAKAAFDAHASLHNGLIHSSDAYMIVESMEWLKPTLERDIDAWFAARGLVDSRISFEVFCELLAAITRDRNILEEKHADAY